MILLRVLFFQNSSSSFNSAIVYLLIVSPSASLSSPVPTPNRTSQCTCCSQQVPCCVRRPSESASSCSTTELPTRTCPSFMSPLRSSSKDMDMTPLTAASRQLSQHCGMPRCFHSLISSVRCPPQCWTAPFLLTVLLRCTPPQSDGGSSTGRPSLRIPFLNLRSKA